jgi:hypothetical protein
MGFRIQISGRINAFREFPRQMPGQYIKLVHILYKSFTTRHGILTAVKTDIDVF